MPTSTGIRRLTDSHLDDEARCQARIGKAIRLLVKVTDSPYWKVADEIQYAYLQRHSFSKIKEMVRKEYCIAYGIDWEGRSSNKKYESFSASMDRLMRVGTLDKKLYDMYRTSGKTFWAIYLELEGNSEKRILKKDTKKALDKAHVTMLQKRAKEGNAEAIKELETMNDKLEPEKDKGRSMTYEYDEWKELKEKVIYYIKQEPRKFYGFIIRLSNEEVLNSGWGRLAKRELELIDLGS